MVGYRISVIVSASVSSTEQILNAADTLQAAISSAVADVERAGFRVSRVELERESIPV